MQSHHFGIAKYAMTKLQYIVMLQYLKTNFIAKIINDNTRIVKTCNIKNGTNNLNSQGQYMYCQNISN